MKYIDLLGKSLKSDFLIDLLETYDTQVVYEYDRTHENLADKYHVEIADLGLRFVFDETQILQTLFVTLVDVTTFNPFDDDDRFRVFVSKSEARQYAKDNDILTLEGQTDFLGEHRDWIRLENASYTIHYEYIDSALTMITLQINDV